MSYKSKSLAWNGLVPALAIALALIIVIAHGNEAVFLLFNGLGSYTGDLLWANWTLFGDALALAALILPFVGRRPALVWSLVVTALIAGIVVSLLKQSLAMPRPPAVLAVDVIHLIGPAYKTHSFPSGHTAAAFAYAGVLSLHFRRAWITAAALGLAIGVGISRMAVGVHWPLDVAAGAALGWLCAVAGVAVAARWRWGESLAGQRVTALLLMLAALALLVYFKADSPLAALLPKGIAVVGLLAALPGLGRLWRQQAG